MRNEFHSEGLQAGLQSASYDVGASHALPEQES